MGAPILNVTIEDKNYSIELDIGLAAELSLEKNHLDDISSKTLIGTITPSGMKGFVEKVNVYEVPKMKIGETVFFSPRIREEDALEARAIFMEDGRKPQPTEAGRIGWEVFVKANLLLDFKNSEIVFCDSIETLELEGYSLENLTSTSLTFERFIEIDVNTPDGFQRCMLDTGSTINFLDSEKDEEKALDEMVWDPKNISNYSFLEIGGKNFGPTEFLRVPIGTPEPIKMILGMEFLRDQLVFIDFSKEPVYFLDSSS